MNSWQHPDQEASISTYTGTNLIGGAPSVSESLVTGCENLSFEPTIEPVPLNTQADAGTGVSVFLKVPQHVKVEDGVGSRLTCLPGEWTGSPTGFSYQWLVNGEVGREWPVLRDPVGGCGQVRAVSGESRQCGWYERDARDAVGNDRRSDDSDDGAAGPGNGAAGAAGGRYRRTERDGVCRQSVTCALGTWTGAPTFTYQWLRNGTPIAGATSSTYTLQAEDTKTVVQCLVTGANAGGKVGAVSANKSISASATPPVRSTVSWRK